MTRNQGEGTICDSSFAAGCDPVKTLAVKSFHRGPSFWLAVNENFLRKPLVCTAGIESELLACLSPCFLKATLAPPGASALELLQMT
jgi:hypothetical protein